MDLPGVASVERLRIIEEYLVHQSVYASADDQIDPRLAMQLVPNALNVREDRRIDPVEFLKFVDDQGQRRFNRVFENRPEELSESLDISEERTREDARYVFLKNRTQVLLGTL